MIAPERIEAPHLFIASFTPAEVSAGSGGLSGTQQIEITHRTDCMAACINGRHDRSMFKHQCPKPRVAGIAAQPRLAAHPGFIPRKNPYAEGVPQELA